MKKIARTLGLRSAVGADAGGQIADEGCRSSKLTVHEGRTFDGKWEGLGLENPKGIGP